MKISLGGVDNKIKHFRGEKRYKLEDTEIKTVNCPKSQKKLN